jgi:hypothetical protein
MKGRRRRRGRQHKVKYALWSCSDERLMTPSFSITLRIPTFRSFLIVASCTTIPAQITRDPAPKVFKSGPDKEQALSQTRTGGSSGLPSRSCDNLGLESLSRDTSSVTTWSWFVTWENWRLVITKSVTAVFKSLSSSDIFASRAAFSRAAA